MAAKREVTQAHDPAAGTNGVKLELQSTIDLVTRARDGDGAAWDVVFKRCEKGLRRFAAGRLPVQCRGMNDT